MEPIVVTPPTVEPITLAEARNFLRIDVPGFPGDTSQDAFIQSCIVAARRAVENVINQSIGVQTLMVAAESFYHLGYRCRGVSASWWPYSDGAYFRQGIELPRGPVRGVTSVKYLQADGTDVTVDPLTYRLTQGAPQRVVLKPGGAWPSDASLEPESVRITYQAGMARGLTTSIVEDYADSYVDGYSETTVTVGGTEPFPLGEDLIVAMRLLIGHFWLQRSAAALISLSEIPLGVSALLWPNRASLGV